MQYLFVIFLGILSVTGCSGIDYNPSVFAYEFNAEYAHRPIRTVMISPINMGKPSRHYLTRHEESIDEHVRSYLKDSGYTVISNRSFDALWKKSLLEFGNTYNPSTGEMTTAFKPALQNTLQKLFAQHPQLDAVIFTDLKEAVVHYSNASKRIAQWDGVRRKAKIEGVGEDITEEFNWAESVDGISIGIHVVNREQQLIQHSFGGIQIAQSIKLNNKTARFGRRNDLLLNSKEIHEGIELAFHPWIIMKQYPGKPQ